MKARPTPTLLAALAAITLLAEPPQAKAEQKPLKVLMIGNSFSVCVMNQMPSIAMNLGCKLDLASLFIPGCPLSRHAANLDATNAPYSVGWNYQGKTNLDAVPFAEALVNRKGKDGKIAPGHLGNLRKMIAADKWDVVTIQQASPGSWDPKSYQPHADKLIAAIRELAPQAEIRIQQTWSYCAADKRIRDPETKGPGTWGFDQTGMYERLTANYTKLAKDNGLKIIPMGLAVQKFRQARGIQDHEGDVVGSMSMKDGKLVGDTIHLNGGGHYLQGLVWTGALFGVDVTACTHVPKGMDSGLAEVLRTCAAGAVAEMR